MQAKVVIYDNSCISCLVSTLRLHKRVRVRHLVVTEDENTKNIIGVITTTDLAKYLNQRLKRSDKQSSLLLQAITAEAPTEEQDIP